MLNILVVDDEPKHRKGLSRMLQGLNPKHNIFHARDGAEALESISVHPIDLVFTDIQMPVMGGLEFVEHLTRRGGNECVIIMSAYSEFAYAQRALQLGARDYLLKPVEEDRIAPLLAKAEQKANTVRLAASKASREWLFALSDRPNDRKRCKAEMIIESCKTYIDTHYHEEDLSLSTLAAKFHFNPSYFCNLFKTHSRMTIHQYITQTRMKAAAKLLLHTSQKVYQIAENVGYKDVKYFIRLFRKEFGTSPEEYRHLSAIR
ncbi:response regulator [Paenibacillus sp. TH7-28]